MNIGIDVRSLLRGRYHGIGEYTYQLLAALFELDQTNQYWLFYNNFQSAQLPEFLAANVHYVGFRYPNKILSATLALTQHPHLDELIARHYLLYAKPLRLDAFFLPNLELAAFSPNLPLVQTVHDLSFWRFPEFFSRRAQWWHKMVRVRRSLERATHLITDSQQTAAELLAFDQKLKNKISVIPLASDPQLTTLINVDNFQNLRTKYNLPEKYILGLGALEPRKNWESLFLAWQKLRANQQINSGLVIAGGRGWRNERLFELVRHSRFRREVRLLFNVSLTERANLYAGAQMFVYPSWYEGFGLPPLEAMRCQTPVVVSNATSLPEVCGSAALYVNPGNLNELAAAIQRLSLEEDLRQRLIQLGLQQVAKFSWRDSAAQTLKVLQSLNK